MSEPMCRYCAERGKTWSGSDPRCAFREDGTFDPENWACASMLELREVAKRLEVHCRDDQAAASIGAVPFEGETYTGYIVMSWYKERGRTGRAVLMWDDEPLQELNRQMAEEAIEYWRTRWPLGLRHCPDERAAAIRAQEGGEGE
jgi:hypothetical protein